MAYDLIKKGLGAVGLREAAVRVKRRMFPTAVDATCRPCTPHLLVAVHRALRWAAAEGAADGAYLEFGLFRGFTFWYAQASAADLGLAGMRFVGFDSFAGLPEVKSIDRGGEFSSGQYACGKADVERNLTELGVDWARTALVEGFYDATLTPKTRADLGLTRCAVAVVDCDLYESTVPVLEFLRPLIVGRCVVLFDDWRCYGDAPDRGEQRAFAEFRAKYPEVRAEPFVGFGPYGQGFVLSVS